MIVPFLDLTAQYRTIKSEIDSAVQSVLDSTAFAGGPIVKEFEDLFSIFCNSQYTVGVNSGTTALWMALLKLGIKTGDKVITTPNTFFATAEAISRCGATPVFIDIEPQTYNIDPSLIEKAICPQVKAIIPVHLYGQAADLDPIMRLAKHYNLAVIEDACQAHGAEYKEQKVGSLGDAGCFSFYPGKNLGAYGEAGAITTNNKELSDTLRKFRDHGQEEKYYHTMIGWNSRMDGIQGAVLKTKLNYLPQWTQARIRKAKLYNQLFAGTDQIVTPYQADYAKHVYHVYAVRVRNRDKVFKKMAENRVTCAIHYPLPIHLQKAYKYLGLKKGDFPVAEETASSVLSLPLYPELPEEQIIYTAERLIEAVS